MAYGFTYKLEDLPEDNIWKVGNELTLKDDSVVFGYEGSTPISEDKGEIFTPNAFGIWLQENLKPLNPIN